MPLNVTLRPFQEKAVAQYRQVWNQGTSHIGIAPTAFGKSIIIGWLAHKLCPAGWRIISLAHREALVEQNADKVRRVDPDLLVCKEIAGERVPNATGVDVISASIATLRGKRAVECAKAWRADGRKIMLITDECFPAGTLVDGVPIERYAVGDLVFCFSHAEGKIDLQRITHVFKSKPQALVRVSFTDGTNIVCTPNHPFWTGEKYSEAIELPGCEVHRLLPTCGHAQAAPAADVQKHWFGILLDSLRKKTHGRNIIEDHGRDQQGARIEAYAGVQPNAQGLVTGQDGRNIESNRPQTESVGRKWPWPHKATGCIACFAAWVCARVPDQNRNEPLQWHIPTLLQSRLGQAITARLRRGGRRFALQPKGKAERRKKRGAFEVVGVDRVTVLEPGTDGQFSGLCPGGVVYNLEVERHSNYFANGVLVHNCHHALAKSYQDWFAILQPDRHLGLTATPFRGDGESLRGVFPEVAFDISRGEMVDDGWLARPHLFTVTTNTSLRDVKTRAGDYVEGQLAAVIDTAERNQLVLAAANEAADMLATYHNQKVARGVCFTVSVEHAHAMAALFASSGWEAYAIDGSTPIPERRHADERLRRGEGRVVLCSCGVLTEGWDVEEVNLGLFARPTKSGVLAEQMMGRVLRYLEGKPTVLLVDFQDQWAEGRMTLAKPWHLPELWDCQGEDVRADELWFHGKLKTVNISTQSEMWACTSRAEVEALLCDTSARKGRTLDRTYLWWDLGEEVRMSINTGSVVVRLSPQGDYLAEWRRGQEVCYIGNDMSLSSVCDQAEMWIDQYHPDDARFLRGREKWQPPSDKQVAYMKRQGMTVPEGLTKYQASQLINERRMQQNKSTEGGYVTFGKYNGFHVTEIPSHYIRWMLAPERDGLKHRPEYAMFQNELARREGGCAPVEVGGANDYWRAQADYGGHDDG